MTSRYRLLGMDRDISRRDFLNGSAMAIGAALLPGCSGQASAVDLSDYPPAKMGMRGAHPGAFEAAHALVEGRSWETQALAEDYDVIVVGAGISGLTAAYIYTRDIDPQARILILDNHDDFGGHAKRNEFTYEGRTLIGFGGTMLIEEPAGYPEVAKTVIRELGIDYARADDYYQADFFTAQGLQTATFFDAETFGQDHLGLGGLFDPSVLINAPLSEGAKADLARLSADKVDPLADKTDEARRNILNGMSWQDYLKAYLGLGDEALRYIQKRSHGVWAIGADALPAYLAAADSYPGFGKT
ncbi:MAG: NAD(P)-binding protein, partial [Pseudomonadota bacterium]